MKAPRMKAATIAALILAIAILGVAIPVERHVHLVHPQDEGVTVTRELTTPAIVSGPVDSSADSVSSSARVQANPPRRWQVRKPKHSFFARLGKVLGIEVRPDRREVSDQRSSGPSRR